MSTGRLRVGTSGWVYGHWRGAFYPEDLPQREWFAYYAERLGTVEINNTFYRLPSEDVVLRWRDAAPAGFTYAVKAHRRITHQKRLLDPDETVPGVLERLALLGDRLGPVLFQLPPRFRYDGDRLRDLLEALPEGGPYVAEFRDDSWYNDDAYEALVEHGVALCLHDLHGEPTPRVLTAPHVYVRFHGPREAYRGRYGPKGLAPWARDVAGWLREGRDVWCYFNNDEAAYAVRDALALREAVAERAPRARVA